MKNILKAVASVIMTFVAFHLTINLLGIILYGEFFLLRPAYSDLVVPYILGQLFSLLGAQIYLSNDTDYYE